MCRIGIDEISYKRGHRYLMVVVDHDSGRLVWATPGHDKATLGRFFDDLGPHRCGQIRLVSADAMEWIGEMVAERCGNATLCLDAYHVVAWASAALDTVRRQVWNDARRAGMTGHATELKGCRYALWKNPEDLTARQAAKLAWIAATNSRLYRAYLLKEQLRAVFAIKGVFPPSATTPPPVPRRGLRQGGQVCPPRLMERKRSYDAFLGEGVDFVRGVSEQVTEHPLIVLAETRCTFRDVPVGLGEMHR